MNKGLTITLIVLLLTLVIGLIVGLTIMIKKDFTFSMFSFNSISTTLVEEKEINNIKDLNIKFDTSDIEVIDTEDEIIKVQIYSDYEKSHKIEENEDEIYVEFKQKNGLSFFRKTSKIYIYVPKEYSNKITINGDVGDIHINDIESSTLKADLNVADIHIDNIDKANIKIDTGDLKIDTINDLVADLNTGDLKIEYLNNYIDTSLDVGDVKIEYLEINENSKIELQTGDVKIQNTNDIYIDADAKVGDTKIGDNNRKAEIELTIKVNVGDIKVNKK